MVSSLPLGNFEWVSGDLLSWTSEKIQSLDDNAPVGYVFQVDLLYPQELHNEHNDYPCAPENSIPPNSKYGKLMATLENKYRYIIHYRLLKLYLSLGLKLSKVHRILSFNQASWLEKYIMFNTSERAKATNDFHKDFYKFMNNSIYGKTMENVDKRRDVKFISSWNNDGRRRGARSLISDPFFHSMLNFDNNQSAIEMKKSKVVYDKPIYVGFSILDESKRHMYDFHYNYMKNKFQDKITLAYTDTDSLIYQVKTEDFYSDIKPDLKLYFDTSNYESNNVFGFDLLNKKKLGFFKDENGGKIMTEFVGLKSKMYSFTIQDVDGDFKRAKGLPESSIKFLSIADYKNCIYKKLFYYISCRQFRSKLHRLYTLHLNKLGLDSKDDKRYILSDGVTTLAWGHYFINLDS